MEHFYGNGALLPFGDLLTPRGLPGGAPRQAPWCTRVEAGKDKVMDLKVRWGMHVAPHYLAYGRGCGEWVRRARVSPCGHDRSSIDTRVATETMTTKS